jgi:predicted TPR repeat methyltransferase
MQATNASESSTSEPGESMMTIGDAVAFAMQRHQAGDLRQARQIYEAVLEREPDRVDVLNVLGILKYQVGELDDAIALMRRVVAARPEADGTWNNLGNALLGKNEIEESAMAFKRSLELVPSADAWANLSRVFRRRGDLSVSEQTCLQALALVPDHGVATHNLALALLGQRKIEQGVECALRAMQLLQPRERRRQVYVQYLLVADEPEQAAIILRAWREQEPDNPYVLHHLAACDGGTMPQRASDAYVESEFDCFAATFDTTLARLNYRAPWIVAEAVTAALPAPARQFDVIDLGCGTGLCGPLLAPWARQLVGCDLSAEMLMQAARREVYDELRKAELTAFLRGRPDAYDLVVSADTLNYFGELGEVAQAVHDAMRPGALFVFTLEALAGDDAGVVRLLPHGRYAHDGAHARRVFAQAGLAVDEPVDVILREENKVPVRGWLIVARRVHR